MIGEKGAFFHTPVSSIGPTHPSRRYRLTISESRFWPPAGLLGFAIRLGSQNSEARLLAFNNAVS